MRMEKGRVPKERRRQGNKQTNRECAKDLESWGNRDSEKIRRREKVWKGELKRHRE